MDIIDNANQIKEAKATHDKVIVIVHGGHEYYNLPSPRMQKQYRFYADQGADFVVGHHTHCISGYEVYNGVPIYYSLPKSLK
jgi:poly-gamma-glutamate capsule biosynthesis protein CapA/YwtB (metallophosphatase superfamily)